jgi:hypothetical protein
MAALVPEPQSRLLAFQESGATARLPGLICKLAVTCVRVHEQTKGAAQMLREPI